MDWQTAVVIVLEVLAVGYLASRFFAPAKSKNPKKPDVDVRALVRRRSTRR